MQPCVSKHILFWQCALRSGKSELTRKMSPRRKILRNFSKIAGIVSTKSCHCPITFSHAQFHFPTLCYASYKVFFLLPNFVHERNKVKRNKLWGKMKAHTTQGPWASCTPHMNSSKCFDTNRPSLHFVRML